MTDLATLLTERDWLMADGATGTNLFNMGLEAGEAPELWNETEPAKIGRSMTGRSGRGSDIFLTNSFRAMRAGCGCMTPSAPTPSS